MRDPVIEVLESQGTPVIRENYLALAYPDNLPTEWTAELEAQLPEEIRDFSQVMSPSADHNPPGAPTSSMGSAVDSEPDEVVRALMDSTGLSRQEAEERLQGLA